MNLGKIGFWKNPFWEKFSYFIKWCQQNFIYRVFGKISEKYAVLIKFIRKIYLAYEYLKLPIFNCSIFPRNLRLWFALYFLDSSLPSNAKPIANIQQEMFHSRTLEAFLESAPQFILQCSILWKTDNYSKWKSILKLICRLVN